ncbi:MAG: LCP family protein [Spirochaetota bacterium]
MIRTPKLSLSFVLLLVAFLVVGITAFVVHRNVRTDSITSMVENDETIRVLIAFEEDERLVSAQVLFYNPVTNRGGIFDVPRKLGAIFDALDRVDSIAALYRENDVETYKDEVEELLDVSVPFYLVLDGEQLSHVVDLAEGMEVFIADSYQSEAAGVPSGEAGLVGGNDDSDGVEPQSFDERIRTDLIPGTVSSEQEQSPSREVESMLPAGNVVLDGAKARTYLTIAPSGESDGDRIARRLKFGRRFLQMLGENADELRHEQVRPYVSSSFETNLDERSLSALIGRLALLDTSQLIQRRIQGNFRQVDSAGETKELLFPHFEGEWLRQAVRQVEQSIGSTESFAEGADSISVEILNGTSVDGLARRTKELFEGYGFDVVSFDNAEEDEVEYTQVIDRTGEIDTARRTAGIIRATRITSEPLTEDSAVDVTVLLGQDFDGTYVRE